MDRLKELKEAKAAAEEVIIRIDSSISSLDSASSWGFWDLLGGGFFSSWLKRSNIQEANADIRAVKASLDELSKELDDVNMTIPTEISDTITDNVFDVWFDNIFTDIFVQGEIKDSTKELKEFRGQIFGLVKKLDLEIQEITGT